MSDGWLVSIITPAYEAAGYLERVVRNVREQSYAPFEHIVVDGGSTDGSVGVLGRFPHVRWISVPDQGQADALNHGFCMAKGEIIGWINADDTYEPNAIEVAVDHLVRHHGLDGVYGQLRVLDESGAVLRTSGPCQYQYEDLLFGGAAIPQQSAFWHRRVTDDVRLDVELRYALDWDFWLRVLSEGYRFAAIDRCAGNLHMVEGSKTSAELVRFWPEELRVLERALTSYRPVPADVADEARRRLQYKLGLSYASVGHLDEASTLLREALAGGSRPYGGLHALAEHTVGWAKRPIHAPLPDPEADCLAARFGGLLRPIDRDLAAHVCMLWALRAHSIGRATTVRRFATRALAGSVSTWRNRGLWSIVLQSLLMR